VHITAGTAEYFNAESLVIFTGSVVATQGDATLTGERLEVKFTAAATPPGGKPGSLTDAQSGRRISTLTATQNVTFRQVDAETGKERYATGEKAVYEAEARIVTLTGSPRLWENKNVIVGEEMVFHLADKRVVVKGKVNLTVYPEDGPGAAAPK
jgi:lipopolysaccharide export system protein LptA